MDTNEIVLIALKHKVTAISKSNGREIWVSELRSGGIGSSGNFITLSCDDTRVFAYSSGQLHCLDLSNGRLLWTNQLRGYGYGLASICVPGYGSAPDMTAIKHLTALRDASDAS